MSGYRLGHKGHLSRPALWYVCVSMSLRRTMPFLALVCCVSSGESYSEPLMGRFQNTSTTDSSENQSSQSAPTRYWSPGNHQYDSPTDQKKIFTAKSGTNSHSILELQSSSSSDAEEDEHCLPNPQQFLMNDLRLSIRITPLLLQRPSYKRIMQRAWSNTILQCQVSPRAGTKYQAYVAKSLISQYDQLRR